VTEKFKVIIPARLGSTRLPGKMLLEIGGKPLLQHVYYAARKSNADQILIATDDQQICNTAKAFGAECVMTSAAHTSGTDRLAEVVEKFGFPDGTVIVNVQGDEIGLPAELINQVATLLINNPAEKMATLCEEIFDEKDINNPNVVKVVFNKIHSAIYFSRLPIPWHKQGLTQQYFRHIGLYAYRAGFLKEYSHLPRCELEQKESLEQLRALYNGINILVEVARSTSGIGIDTEDDLNRARQQYKTSQK
jgi:3-deoxy-manno-octulosonate cytidylyltransferase (CMP-KDO synthetase)